MAMLVFGMNQSLDGYVDHTAFAPGARLFRHFIAQAARQTGGLYGRVLYGLMRYWDDDRPEWSDDEREFARAWRRQHKWVVSSTLTEVGPNATLLGPDLEGEVRRLKDEAEGEIEVGGPRLAHALGQMGLIDAYRIYLHPVVTGPGVSYFAGPRPPLRLTGTEIVDDSVVLLTYVPA
jgi:dihydrofolate reductase